MAIFDEYKQAIQDVLDGKTKEPPQPSAFPDEQDMLAALYAAAAALSLLKEAPSGTGGGVLVVHETVSGGTHTLDKTWQEIHDFNGISVVIGDTPDGDGTRRKFDSVISVQDDPAYIVFTWDGIEYSSGTASGYPSFTE